MRQLPLDLRGSRRSGGSLFGAYKVRIDPWDVDYGDQTPLSPSSIESPDSDDVDHQIEVVEAAWAPIHPSATTDSVAAGAADSHLPRRVIFIDGVRRLEARLHVWKDAKLVYGAFGCYAVGAVELAPAAATFAAVRVHREVVLGAGEKFPEAVQVRPALQYEPESTPEAEVDAPLRHIQDAMRRAEARLAGELSGEEVLTIVDGPLSFEPGRGGLALGYVKRIHQLYIPGRLLAVLAGLPAGARTPLFLIKPKRSGFARYSWFQRLAPTRAGDTELHGIVRLEASGRLALEEVRRLADAAALWLPRVAPSRARDPRSPQNLLPIGALEQKLRIASGNAALTRRWIETLVVQEVTRG